MYKVIYNPKVYIDLQQAIDWYEDKQVGLGMRFLKNIKNQMNQLSITAKHYVVRYDDIRCMTVNSFPYMVHYSIDEDNHIVFVEAVFNTGRNPKLWERTRK